MSIATSSRTTRSEIQALRAVAVLAVVIYHIWPDALPGGFVGVDIFFVISGFLITSHLLREVARDGSVTLRQFWARRIRRLLPAAFVVIAFCLAAMFVLLPWGEWKQTLKEVLASVFYVENWVLAADSVDYLAAENSASLVQHYWSLSVEEQFYILWPVLILGALWVGRRIRSVTLQQAIGGALLLVFVGSLALSVWWTATSPASAYFATFARAWEFAAGGLLAFLPAKIAGPARTRAGSAMHMLASWGGLAAIAFAVMTFNGATPFPSYTALLPVLGTVAVIWAAESSSAWSPTHLGRSGPIQWVGDVSYSLYLWHWPLVVLYPIVRGQPIGPKGGAALLVICLALAWLTKRYVEDPFRTSAAWKQPRRTYGAAVVGMAAVSVVVIASNTVLDSRFGDRGGVAVPYATVAQLQDEIRTTLDSRSWKMPDQVEGREAQASEWVDDGCLDVTNAGQREKCVYGDVSSDKSIVVIGDSYATQLLPALRAAYGDEYSIHPLTLSQCPVIDVPVTHSEGSGRYERCVDHNEKYAHLVSDIDPDLLLVADSTSSTHWRFMGDKSESAEEEVFAGGALRAYRGIAALGVTDTIVIEAPPSANCEPTSRLSSPSDCSSDSTTELIRDLQGVKVDAAADAGLGVIDMTPWLCDERLVCPSQVGERLTRADGAHFTDSFAESLAPVIAEEIERIS